jgi:hypothetical protein
MPTVEEIMCTTDSLSRTMCVPSWVGHRGWPALIGQV